MDIFALKRRIQSLLAMTGFELRRIGRSGSRHEKVEPLATYAPWNEDQEFVAALGIAQSHTLVDMYRCHELWCLVRDQRGVAGDVLEVGVWRGGTGALLAKSVLISGSQSKVFLCDTFSGTVKSSARDTEYRSDGQHADTSAAVVASLLERMDAHAEIVEGIFPDETSAQVSTLFRFVHIDVDVYASARDVFRWAWPRLAPGGIVVFDDYGFSGCDGVTSFVDAMRTEPDRVVVHNLNGHAVVVKTGGEHA